MKQEEYKFSSGLQSLDNTLQGIKQGDNVVFQSDSIKDFQFFVKPFCENAIAEGKTLVYLRFSDHSSLMPSGINVETYNLDPQKGFETFISSIFEIIEAKGPGACYVFDCLSNLAVDWYSDRMLGNFFMLTCPYLYDYDTVAYFVLLKNHHSPFAIDAIHKTAQVVLDIFRSKNKLYLLPLKVLGRHSPTLYMLHSWKENEFRPVTRSVIISDILSVVPNAWIDFNIDRRDIWTETFIEAQQMNEEIHRNLRIPGRVDSLKSQLIKMVATRDANLTALCEKYFDLSNMICIGKRMIGTGLIGGKSVGMLLARIILKKEDEKWVNKLETHDSFYVGSDVFYTYIIQNRCWWDRKKLEKSSPEFEASEDLQKKILSGEFPEDIIEEFKDMLSYFGQSPIIVRSSSLLEDGYGNAFSGKYESVFCANQGTPEQRLENFLTAIRLVYASTMNKDALTYRTHKNLINADEQMALLVQRVSGAFNDEMYYPHIAGVGYSFNPFVWNSKIDPSEGVLRLVFGLGTHAVDSVGDDYTRVVSINEPLLRPEMDFNNVRKYAQRRVDLLDLKNNKPATYNFEKVAESSSELPIQVFASKDLEIEERAKAMKMKNVFSWVLNFEKLLTKTDFIKDMREILTTLEEAYQQPVDIEFSCNFINENEYRINLLQCRPFQVNKQFKSIQELAQIKDENMLMKTPGPIIGQAKAQNIDLIVYILPSKYSEMSMQNRHAVARLVGELTNKASKNLKTMLIGPGRWGTSMPSLGIPVSFTEIKNASIICELVAMHEGLTPDVSLGTHFFNDLVEMDILYMAFYPNKQEYFLNEELLIKSENKLLDFLPSAEKFEDSILVIDTKTIKSGFSGFIHANTLEQQVSLFLSEKNKK